jgi:hypothetical protein
VLIDQNPVGVSPWTGDLVPGAHSVDLTLRGFEDLSQTFDLPRDHALDIELELTSKAASERTRWQVAADSHPAVELPATPALTIVNAPPKREEGSTLTTLGWTILSAGGAALGGAVVFELLRQGAEKDAQRETRQIQFAQDLDSMRSRRTIARVLVGVGATLAVAGGTLLVLRLGRSERAPDALVSLACAPQLCQTALTGRF